MWSVPVEAGNQYVLPVTLTFTKALLCLLLELQGHAKVLLATTEE